jgi:hypothetical protein
MVGYLHGAGGRAGADVAHADHEEGIRLTEQEGAGMANGDGEGRERLAHCANPDSKRKSQFQKETHCYTSSKEY